MYAHFLQGFVTKRTSLIWVFLDLNPIVQAQQSGTKSGSRCYHPVIMIGKKSQRKSHIKTTFFKK